MSDITKIASSLDRLREAHHHLHGIENFYHFADPFRWSLNSFLRSLKEVPQILKMDLQNEPDFPGWYEAKRKGLISDPLISFLFKSRDIIVHQKMLLPQSSVIVGISDGIKPKSGLSIQFSPYHNSDVAIKMYLIGAKGGSDPLSLLEPDEETLPCVIREWKLPQFDEDLLNLSARAWLRVAEVVDEVIQWLGVEPIELSLDCLHSSQDVKIKLYDREELMLLMDELPDEMVNLSEPLQ